MPPLEELNKQVTDNTKQNEEESANPMDTTGNSPDDTAQLGGNITPPPTDGHSHKNVRTADTPNSKDQQPSKTVKN